LQVGFKIKKDQVSAHMQKLGLVGKIKRTLNLKEFYPVILKSLGLF